MCLNFLNKLLGINKKKRERKEKKVVLKTFICFVLSFRFVYL